MMLGMMQAGPQWQWHHAPESHAGAKSGALCSPPAVIQYVHKDVHVHLKTSFASETFEKVIPLPLLFPSSCTLTEGLRKCPVWGADHNIVCMMTTVALSSSHKHNHAASSGCNHTPNLNK
eukprot:825994-Amphidinium_carterae.1